MEAQTISPMMERGRSDARELMSTAARIVRKAGATDTADAATVLSTALQLLLTTSLVDGYEAQEVYSGLAGALAWSVKRLEPEDRIGVLTAIVSGVVAQTDGLPAEQTESKMQPTPGTSRTVEVRLADQPARLGGPSGFTVIQRKNP